MSAHVGRFEKLLPVACVLSAGVLFASQLMTIFEFTPPGAEPLADRSVIDHHGPALLMVGVFAVFAAIAAVWASSKPAAIAVATMGGIALLIFLLIDLPDAGQVGTLDDVRQSFFDAEAVPQAGFWLEMLGALGLAISGIALATMTPDQLGAMRPGARRKAAETPPVRIADSTGNGSATTEAAKSETG